MDALQLEIAATGIRTTSGKSLDLDDAGQVEAGGRTQTAVNWMTIMITGGAGYIGSHVCVELLGADIPSSSSITSAIVIVRWSKGSGISLGGPRRSSTVMSEIASC